MSEYKNQHYVPRSILKNFRSDSDEFFYFFKGAFEKPVIHRNTQKVFSKNHLYSFDEKDGSKNSEVESKFFKELDTQVDPIVEKIISRVREGSLPQLAKEEKKIWNDFYIKQHARIPERLLGKEIQESLDENYQNIKSDVYDRCVPRLQVMLDDPKFKQRLQAETRVRSLTTNLAQSNEILAERGMFFTRILNPKKSFIIGSNPLVRCNNRGSSHLAEVNTELWYPVAHDIAISIGSYDDAEVVHDVTAHVSHGRFIDRLNNKLFEQSDEIAGRSKALIQSLTRDFVKNAKND